MPVYAGNGSLENAGGRLTIKDSSGNAVFDQGVGNGFGFYNTTGTPGFIAGSTSDPGWVTIPSGTWTKVNQYATTVVYNKGGHYNTSTTRFTAPITGPYLFVWSVYAYQVSYYHPQFAVNGDVNLRRGTCPYRIRGYGNASNYQTDAQIEEVIYLVAGDYVEVLTVAGGGVANMYLYYGLFSGVFVG